MKEIIGRGAEAILYKGEVFGQQALIKDRIKKGYRVDELDIKLRKHRTKREGRLLSEARRAGVNTPAVLKKEETKLFLEFIEGDLIRELVPELEKKSLEELMRLIGDRVRRLHINDIIHGDLTTSNMIKSGGEVYLIDFGLGFFSDSLEDKAVDIHVFKEALKSKHNQVWELCFDAFKEGYGEEGVLRRLKKVEERGRYK